MSDDITTRARRVLDANPNAVNVSQGNVGSTPLAFVLSADGRMLAIVNPDEGYEVARLIEERAAAEPSRVTKDGEG